MRKKTSRFLQKIAATLLSGALAMGCLPAAGAASVSSAPLAAQTGAENGMVRVYLSSLGNPSSLTLTTAGSYSVNGNTSQSLSSGTSVTVGFNSATGAITLTKGGVKTNMGTYFALRRHSTTGTNGIKIAQGRKPENPYPGDISFQAVQSGGSYKLYTIAHIYMENYLYGVLPYEMGNSANIEALKAQAVAARTYTVRMMQSRASGYYDVVDTTNDQVYNGTPTGNANCVAAVDATKGIVVKNGSAYTATYYSASNGGQTESILNAWGTTGYSYLSVKDDPFDLANPDSVVKRYTVYASCSTNNASLLSLLKTKAVTALKNSGYAAASDNTTLQTVRSVTPHTPKYASPSKLYTKMDFALTVSTRSSSGASTTANITVTCNIFSELESLLGMSIQSTANELWSVSQSGGNFVLEARRYGHGLGMSQRGAMYMGKQGYTYDQILGFYYNDCQRVRISFTHTILSANSSDTITTVEPPAEIEDADTACAGVVKLTGASAVLAIRGEKSTSGKLLGVIANNSPVNVYANDGTWCFIRFGNIKGYVPANALTLTGTAPASTGESVSSTIGFATVKANGYLNLRASGSITANIITTAPSESIFTVFSKDNGWAHIQFGATVAYASTDFLVFSTGYPGDAVSSGTLTATIHLSDTAATASLRKSASTDSETLMEIPHGATVTVIRDDGLWSEIEYKGTVGYVVSASLVYGDGTVSGGGSDSTDITEKSATVQVAKAAIYEKQDASSAVLLEVAMGQSVVVTETGSTWCAVRYEGVTGYMLTSALNLGSSGGSGTVETTAIVATQQGSLNLRMSAKAGSAVLTTIPKGTQVTVTSRGGTWTAVTYKGIYGYVMSSYLQFSDGSGTGTWTPGASGSAMVVTVSGSLNLRAQGVAGSAILRTIPRLTTVTVHQWGADWSYVTYQGTTGYVMSVFLVFASDSAADGDSGAPGTALQAKVTTASGSLNLRSEPSLNGRILTQIPQYAVVDVELQADVWCVVNYGSFSGHVMTQYLTFLASEAPVALSAEADAEDEADEADETADASEDKTKDTVKSAENTENTENAEKTESTENTENTESAQNTVGAENTENTDGDTSEKALMALVNTASGALNLRIAADGESQVLASLPQGTQVQIIAYGETWCRIGYEVLTGYVRTEFLTIGEPGIASLSVQEDAQDEQQDANEQTIVQPEQASSAPNSEQAAEAVQAEQIDDTQAFASFTAWVNTPSGGLNLRETSSLDARVLSSIPRHASITVVQEDGVWSRVAHGELVGYVLSEYLTVQQPIEKDSAESSAPVSVPKEAPESQAAASEDTQSAESAQETNDSAIILDETLKLVEGKLKAQVIPKEEKPLIFLRLHCSETSEALAEILRDEMVQVLMRGETWCQILYDEQIGYCLTESLFFAEE